MSFLKLILQNVIDWDRFTIVGTSQEIFKDYLRLTSVGFTQFWLLYLMLCQEPRPDQIRPYPVLQQTLVELKKRWREKTAYNWICNQFKSLRQDLTVRYLFLQVSETTALVGATICL